MAKCIMCSVDQILYSNIIYVGVLYTGTHNVQNIYLKSCYNNDLSVHFNN